MAKRAFDLNIEEVLENWEVEHALREVIANALDERIMSRSKEIDISKDAQGRWHVRDFGRGLKIEHFTLNENLEKLKAPAGVIGKFGVGLKDALATFYRRGVEVLIRSSFGTFRLTQVHKHGFEDIVTLHVEYDDFKNQMAGTDFILSGLTDLDVSKAKSLFLEFSDNTVLETNSYGQILQRDGSEAKVYILGVLASNEPNFLFSYNITSLTDAMRKKLNRERLNVGRATYTDRIKAILKNARDKRVERLLIDEVTKRATGNQCDEMSWIEISQMALNLMNQEKEVVYFTEEELRRRPEIVDSANRDGLQIVVISEHQKTKLESQAQSGGPEVRTVQNYIQEINESFQFKFVAIQNLMSEERKVFDLTDKIVSLVGISSGQLPKILISENMRVTNDGTEGVWDPSLRAIVIKRSILRSLDGYSGTLLHEVAHAMSGADDCSRSFENVLTQYLGRISVNALQKW